MLSLHYLRIKWCNLFLLNLFYENKVVLLVMMVLCSSFSFYSNHSDKEKIKLTVLDKAAGRHNLMLIST
jgi:hypothetical protein